MSATGGPHRLAQNPAVAETFRQIADIYVEIATEMFKDDPDLCLDVSEVPPESMARTPFGDTQSATR